MTGDSLQRFAAGDALASIRADTLNAFVDATKQVRRERSRGGVGTLTAKLKQGPGCLEVLVRNDTGSTLPERSVTQVSFPLLIPSLDPINLQERPAFRGIVPTSTDATPCILIDPLPADGEGRAVIMGVAVVSIDMVDAAHTHAGPDVGITSHLVSNTTGPATILSRQEGTGVRLAAVLLCCAEGVPAVGDADDWVYPTIPGAAPCSPDDPLYAVADASNKTLDCTCLPDALIYAAALYPIGDLYGRWTTVTCEGNVLWDLKCEDGLYALYVGGVLATAVSHSPDGTLVFDSPNLGANCGAMGGTARITITP